MNIWDTLVEGLEGKTEIEFNVIDIVDIMRDLRIADIVQASTCS